MSLLSLAGGIVGGIVGGPGGAAAGATIGGAVAGGGGNPTQVYTAQTPNGPVSWTYTGRPENFGSSEGPVFDSWAQQGKFDALRSIAGTGSGPDWRNNGQSTFSGYGVVDRNFAAALLQGYGQPASGASNTAAPASAPSTSFGSALERAGQTVLATAQQQAGALLVGTGTKLTTTGTEGVARSSLVPSLSTGEIVIGLVLLVVAVVVIMRAVR